MGAVLFAAFRDIDGSQRCRYSAACSTGEQIAEPLPAANCRQGAGQCNGLQLVHGRKGVLSNGGDALRNNQALQLICGVKRLISNGLQLAALSEGYACQAGAGIEGLVRDLCDGSGNRDGFHISSENRRRTVTDDCNALRDCHVGVAAGIGGQHAVFNRKVGGCRHSDSAGSRLSVCRHSANHGSSRSYSFDKPGLIHCDCRIVVAAPGQRFVRSIFRQDLCRHLVGAAFGQCQRSRKCNAFHGDFRFAVEYLEGQLTLIPKIFSIFLCRRAFQSKKSYLCRIWNKGTAENGIHSPHLYDCGAARVRQAIKSTAANGLQ